MTRSGNLVPGDGRRRNMRVVFAGLIAAVVAVVAGCAAGPGAGEPGSGASSGVEGVTVVDEGCPIQHGTAPCPERPLRARIVVDLEGLANSAYSGPAAAQALGVHPATIYEVARRGRPAVLIMDSSLSRKRFAYSGLPGALTGQNENYWWPPGSDYWEQLCTDAKPQSPCNVP